MVKKNKKDLSEVNIDLSYLQDISNGSNKFMIEMIDIFLKHTPGYFEEIRLAIQEKDWATVANVAHKIGPSISFMGIDAAKDNIIEIERKAITLERLEEIEVDFNYLQNLSIQFFAKLETIKRTLQDKA